jgi:cytochrome c-type biogenesis protein CcmH
MIAFWTLAALAAALAALLVLTAARRGALAVDGDESAAETLAELDRQRAVGLLDDGAWAAARIESARRLLRQGGVARPAPAAGPRDPLLVASAIGVTVAVALGLYLATGAPGMPDQPYRTRVDDWSTRLETLDPAQLAAVAERTALARPDDPQAWSMLGAARFEAGDPIGAASALRRVLAITPDDAQAWARLGECLVRAAEGRIGADAEAAFNRSLQLDPNQLGARYFLGEAALQRGEAAEVRRLWGPLIAALDPADPRRTDLLRRLPVEGAAS